MTTLKIIRLGNPVLRRKSQRVTLRELRTEKFQKFLDNLAAACIAGQGVGIAAPQVNRSKRVIVVHVDPTNPRYPDKKPFPLTIVINPKVTSKSKEIVEDWEGDLSAGLRALVPRAATCVVSGIDRQGEPVTFNLQDPFHARVFQHEIDHLDGRFFLDQVRRKETICELNEYKKFWKGKKPEEIL